MRLLRLLLCLSLPGAQLGCSDDAGVFSSKGGLETKPEATRLAELTAFDAEARAAEESPEMAARVDYDVRVTTRSGARLCSGETTLEILSNFSLRVPDAYVDCVSMHLDLGGMLDAAVAGRIAGEDNLAHDGKVMSVRSLGGTRFDPPRPLLLGPTVQDSKKYEGLVRTTRHDLTATGDDGRRIRGSGSFDIAVIDTEATYEDASNSSIFFDKVLHWEITSRFDTPPKYGLTFSKMTWLWNTRPIMIPAIFIEGSLEDFIESDSTEVIDALAGELRVELFVREYQGF
jgi:hypothetical protein